MGYLDNSTITVDAILTKKGRQKLAQGQSLNITKFALGDDEIDYQLYEPAHPKGNSSADSAILALPITQASPDETQVLRYKILTLPKGATRIPTVNIGTNAITSYQSDGATAFNPNTNPTGNTSAGYTAVLADQRAVTSNRSYNWWYNNTCILRRGCNIYGTGSNWKEIYIHT